MKVSSTSTKNKLIYLGINWRYIAMLPFLVLYLDEEIGGKLGMAKFVQHEEFKKLNVGFGLDEGKK